MKIFSFFIERPITSIVVNLILVLLGLLAFNNLLVDEYPKVVLPKIQISTAFPNASAKTVEEEITSIVEKSLASLEGIDTITSESFNGASKVLLKFSPSVSVDKALMQVSQELPSIKAQLPKEAEMPKLERFGEQGPVFFLSVNSKTMQGPELTHFAELNIKNYFLGLDGVAKVEVWGNPYAMYVKLDKLAMHTAQIDVSDVVTILKKNQMMLQAGQSLDKEPLSLNVVPKNIKNYQDLIVGKNGENIVRLGDIAEISLQEDDKNFKAYIAGVNSVLIGIYKSDDGNILSVSDKIKSIVPKVNEELRGSASVQIESDKSIFTRTSLKTIYKTIIEACLLVLLIIFLFLHNLRATFIPLVTIPISLIASFMVLNFLNYSINTITLLAIVLAVGLVVDDAIVVLENIFRYIENGLSPKEAAKKGIEEIGFAIIAMTLTLVSVFMPLMFVHDITGVVLQQFAVTLACSVFFSGIVALTLSPMMCSKLLKVNHTKHKFFMMSDNFINAFQKFYLKILNILFNNSLKVFISIFLILALGIYGFYKIKKDLLPKEDRSMIGASIPNIHGLNSEEMQSYVADVEQRFASLPEVQKIITLSFTKNTNIVCVLKPHEERKIHAEDLLAKIRDLVSDIPSANVWPWSWDIGFAALAQNDNNEGLSLVFRSIASYEELDNKARLFIEELEKDKYLTDIRKDLNINRRSFIVKPIRQEMDNFGISELQISLALQVFLDGMNASEYRKDSQRYNVYLRSTDPDASLESIYIKSNKGLGMVSLASVAKISEEITASSFGHYNQMRSLKISANFDAKKSLGEVKNYLDSMVSKHVPESIIVSYEGALKEQSKSLQTFVLLMLAGLLFVFFVLAIQFESFINPLIILFTVPMALIGAILVMWLLKSNANLYTQVGMLTLIGLITKHGILLVEYVSQNLKAGINLKTAVFDAANLRFRPIIMTTAATVLGALPLVLSGGAGSEARFSIGIVIVSGMIFGTILTLFFLPLLIYRIKQVKK